MAIGDWYSSWIHFKEKRFARRLIGELLSSYAIVRLEKPELSGEELYRDVLLRTPGVEPEQVDELLRRASDSVDAWTAPGRKGLGFRELVHFFVMSRYQAEGRVGSMISFGDLVNALVPADL